MPNMQELLQKSAKRETRFRKSRENSSQEERRFPDALIRLIKNVFVYPHELRRLRP